MRSPRRLALFAAPLLFLGGCQTISSLGDHAAATVGLGDDAPKTYTASEESKAVRAGIAVADEPLAVDELPELLQAARPAARAPTLAAAAIALREGLNMGLLLVSVGVVSLSWWPDRELRRQ